MKRERILECTFSELAAHGIKRAGVDSIAAKMHISKKTIYDLFENKENLLLSALKYKVGKVIEGISTPADGNGTNVLCGMIENSMRLFKFLHSVSPVLLEDIEYFPAVKEYAESVKQTILENGKKRFAEGIRAGYLIEEADFDIVGRLLESQIMIMGREIGDKYTLDQICYKSLIVILRGVCTEKGIAVLNDIIIN